MATNKKSLGLAWQMLIGLVLGVIVGAVIDAEIGKTYLQPFGTLFIRLIRMVVVPLVIATLIAGAANIADISKLGRVAVKILLLYAAGSALAVIFGLFFANVIDPGVGLNLSTEGLAVKKVTPPPMVQTLLNIVPINPMEALSKGSMLQIIFFAIMFGFGLAGLGEKGRPLVQFFDLVGQVM
ncbi:MAG TPA: dicarboxylate/amino acid:cation symporter, partial [Sutterella sp.]|nr:dicarboxylate/amino acid:cation symporter [Sutterella sp.]